jgi:hypothetical protein
MFVSCVCCTVKDKGQSHDNQDKEVQIKYKKKILPLPLAERPKARVCGRSLAGVAGSNPPRTWTFVVCVLYSKDKKANMQDHQDKET